MEKIPPSSSGIKKIFEGRIGRKHYFFGMLFIFLIFLSIEAISFHTGVELDFLRIIIGIVVLPFSFGLGIRRLHDLGYSGWLLLVLFIPVINIIFGLYMIFVPGKEAGEKYGNRADHRINSVKVMLGMY